MSVEKKVKIPMGSTQVYKANRVIPISSNPIENGEVVVENGKIVDVRQSKDARDFTGRDFGDAILLPGLVNVHTHLDYTVMRGLLEDLPFFTWIRQLTLRKSVLSPQDWLASASWGAAEALSGGVTTIGDCCDSGAAFHAAKIFGMRGIVYQEVFGIDESESVQKILFDLNEKTEALKALSLGTLLQIGISPHAPYTVRPELFRALARYANEKELRVCIHASESPAEGELFFSGTGVIAEMFQRRGIEWRTPGKSAAEYLDSFGILTPRTMLVHGVQVSASDRNLTRERGISWAHCPKSNAKLGAGVAPLGILTGRRFPDTLGEQDDYLQKVGLGSDGVASNNTMDMFEEMRFSVLMQRAFRRNATSPGAKETVEMATIGGARALGLEKEIGTLEPGKQADLCVVRTGDLHSFPTYDPYSALVYATRASDVRLTVINGETRYDADLSPQSLLRFPGQNVASIREGARFAADKLRTAETAA